MYLVQTIFNVNPFFLISYNYIEIVYANIYESFVLRTILTIFLNYYPYNQLQ